MSKITRVEIIDETGRIFSRWNQKVTVSIQDNGQTMKIFIENDPNSNVTGNIDIDAIFEIVSRYNEDINTNS